MGFFLFYSDRCPCMQQDALTAAQIGSTYVYYIIIPLYNFCFKSAEDGTPADVFSIFLSGFTPGQGWCNPLKAPPTAPLSQHHRCQTSNK